MKLFTVGYAEWNCDEMVEMLAGLGGLIRVYDVRYSPSARKPEFSRRGLRARLGDLYIHAAGLGNADYRGGGIRLADPEPWYGHIIEHLRGRGTVVLLCACARLDICHRLLIAKELERRAGAVAVHLHPPKRGKRTNGNGENTGTLF